MTTRGSCAARTTGNGELPFAAWLGGAQRALPGETSTASSQWLHARRGNVRRPPSKRRTIWWRESAAHCRPRSRRRRHSSSNKPPRARSRRHRPSRAVRKTRTRVPPPTGARLARPIAARGGYRPRPSSLGLLRGGGGGGGAGNTSEWGDVELGSATRQHGDRGGRHRSRAPLRQSHRSGRRPRRQTLAERLMVEARLLGGPHQWRREAFEQLAPPRRGGVRNDAASATLWHRSILEESPGFLAQPAQARNTHSSPKDAKEELEPIATEIAKALRGPETTAHALLAMRLRTPHWPLGGAHAISPSSAFRQSIPPLWGAA